eukprot:scaffold11088_cov214-Amphora_coffeaeformis.AAC.2
MVKKGMCYTHGETENDDFKSGESRCIYTTRHGLIPILCSNRFVSARLLALTLGRRWETRHRGAQGPDEDTHAKEAFIFQTQTRQRVRIRQQALQYFLRLAHSILIG